MSERADFAVVGGGLVGLATARALLRRAPGSSLCLWEAEPEICRHQSGHNSGVVHSGLYYAPGSAKAANCTRGREALESFCARHGVAHERCGKVVVAVEERELGPLEELERRGRANGLDGLRRLGPEELREREPAVRGLAALWVPQTGIVDFPGVARALASELEAAGASLHRGLRLRSAQPDGERWVLSGGERELSVRRWVNCAGLESDRVARRAGLEPGVRIVPFRGEYHRLRGEKAGAIRNLVYPVPDPRYPFLGVHFTRRITGGIEAGPNAVLALARRGYRWRDLSLRDVGEMIAWPGFWRMSARHWRTGVGEVTRSWSRRAFVAALSRLMPGLQVEDVEPFGSGVRAQAVARDGRLLDDFHFVEAPGCLHVVNAPSPAATACLSIGESIADRLLRER